MAKQGRGRDYTRVRAAVEWSLGQLFWSGWPAEAARLAGFQRRVATLEHALRVERPLGSGVSPARPLRVGFASDFHAGPTTHPELLALACGALAEAELDLLLLGGDFVFLDARQIDTLAGMLGEIPAPLGRFAVMGNHDLWADDVRIVAALERNGIRVLVNECLSLPTPWDRVSLSGLDDP